MNSEENWVIMKKNEAQIPINKKGAKQQKLRKDVPFFGFLTDWFLIKISKLSICNII